MSLVDALQKKVNTLQSWLYGDRNAIEAEEALGNHENLLSFVQQNADDIDELRDDLDAISDQLDAIQDIGAGKTTKEEKVASLVQYAQNISEDGRMGRVALKARDIKGTAGVSRRYAYDLIDELPDEYGWAMDRSDVDQYGSLEIDRDGQDRALIIDLEGVHSDEEAVNKFTTGTTETEASA